MLTLTFAAALTLLLLAVLGGASRGAGTTLVHGGSAICCAVIAATGLVTLLLPVDDHVMVLPVGLPWLHAQLRLDRLAAFFLLLVGGLGTLASIYALGYGRHEDEPARILPFYPAFLAGMTLVLLAADAFSFIVAWEFMSLASWLLVLSSHRREESRTAAYLYLVMASAGTAALMLAFGMLAGAPGDYSFSAMRGRELSPAVASGVLALILIGAGSKAGIAPLHAWLPLAHPAAPSHVSALMSGAMTKVAIYAIVRMLFDLVGHAEWWWGVVVLLLGGATAVLGILFATIQRDLKTLLAYSTIENIGIVVIGLGLALAFKANALPLLAGVALVAALFHSLNHAVFKGLLFFGAGAVLLATGTRDIDRMGGLLARMPTTAATMLIGCAAIAAIPPLNGFASEWLLFQALLEAPILPQWGLKFAVPVAAALLALAAALAAACFVRAFGIAFLGRPRSTEAESAAECDVPMRASLLAGAGFAVLFGIFPGLAIHLAEPVAADLLGTNRINTAVAPFLWISPAGGMESAYSGFVLACAGAALGLLVVVAVKRLSRAAPRRVPAWDCGFPDPIPATQYRGGSFAQPIRRVFADAVFRAIEHVDMPRPGDRRAAHYAVTVEDRAWHWLYRPVGDAVARVTQRINFLQFLTIRRHLSLMFGALIVLLVIVAVLR